MKRKGEACEECRKRCLSVHRNGSSASNVSSFFKVMIGNQLSRCLYLPPKFAVTVSTLVDQDIFIEDSTSQRWKVKISNLEGSYAFEQGWSKFSSDHGLEIGDFLVFSRHMGSHFYVQIYDDSGCEKLDFVRKNTKRKRFDSSDNSSAELEQYHSNDKAMFSKWSSDNSAVFKSVQGTNEYHNEHEFNVETTPPVVNGSTSRKEPRIKYSEEPYYMMNRDLQGLEEDRGQNFNLFELEMMNIFKERKPIPEGNKVTSHADTSAKSQSQPVFANEDPKSKNFKNKVPADDAVKCPQKGNEKAAQDLKKQPSSDNNHSNGKTSAHLSTASTMKHVGDERGLSEALITSPKRGCLSKGRDGTHVLSEVGSDHSGSMTKAIKVEPALSMNRSKVVQTRHGKMKKTIKDEPVQMTPLLNRKTVPTKCGTLEGSVIAERNRKENLSSGSDVKRTKQNLTRVTNSSELHNIAGSHNHQSYSAKKTVQDEPVRISPSDCKKMIQIKREASELVEEQAPHLNMNIKDKLNIAVKTEPDYSIVPTTAASVTCKVAAGRQSFLELPMCLPQLPYHGMIRKDRVVFLHDPCSRLWPVLYYERSDMQLLTSGWEAFSKANNVQPGNNCVFEVKNMFEEFMESGYFETKRALWIWFPC